MMRDRSPSLVAVLLLLAAAAAVSEQRTQFDELYKKALRQTTYGNNTRAPPSPVGQPSAFDAEVAIPSRELAAPTVTWLPKRSDVKRRNRVARGEFFLYYRQANYGRLGAGGGGVNAYHNIVIIHYTGALLRGDAS